MKKTVRSLTCFVALLFIWSIVAFQPADLFAAKPAKMVKTNAAVQESMADKFPKLNAAYDVSKMGDVSDFDPATYVAPKGDTIKIGYINCFSGPGAINGQIHALPLMYAAHDINRRGGIMVDGKKKMIEVIIGDHQSKADVAKKVAERLVLQDKVHVLVGTSGSNLMKIISNVAEKYKVIAVNNGSLADDLMDATNLTVIPLWLLPERIRSDGAWLTTTARFGKRKRSFISSARTIPSAGPWPRASSRD